MPPEPPRRRAFPAIRSRLEWLRIRRRDLQRAKRAGATEAAYLERRGSGASSFLRTRTEATRSLVLQGISALEKASGTENPSKWTEVFAELKKAEAPLLDLRSLGKSLRGLGIEELEKRVYSFVFGDAIYCFGLGGSRTDYRRLRAAMKAAGGKEKKLIIGTREEIVPRILAKFGGSALAAYSMERGWPFDAGLAKEVSLEVGRKSLRNLSMDRFLDRVLVGYTQRHRQASGAKWRTIRALDHQLAAEAAKHGLGTEALPVVRELAGKILAETRLPVAAAVAQAIRKHLKARAAAEARPVETKRERGPKAAAVPPAQPLKRELRHPLGFEREVLQGIRGAGFEATDVRILVDAGALESKLLNPAEGGRLVARLREVTDVRGLLETAKKWAEHPDAKMGAAGYLSVLLNQKRNDR